MVFYVINPRGHYFMRYRRDMRTGRATIPQFGTRAGVAAGYPDRASAESVAAGLVANRAARGRAPVTFHVITR